MSKQVILQIADYKQTVTEMIDNLRHMPRIEPEKHDHHKGNATYYLLNAERELGYLLTALKTEASVGTKDSWGDGF